MTDASVQLAPRGVLAGFVKGFRVVSRGADARPYVRLPDGEVDLVIRFRGERGAAHAIGPRLSPLRKGTEVLTPQMLVVRFKPGGAYPFFGLPMSELTDRILSLDTLWGTEGARLREALTEAPSVVDRLRLLDTALTERLRRGDVFEPAGAYTVRRAVRLLTEATELPRVDALARELGVSARQLRRAFDDVVGMGPKEFARVVRFQRAVRASERAATPDWGAIAVAAGYYDQSHLITEFKHLTGTTPGALMRTRLQSTAARGGVERRNE
ncbi:helix-turn-helix domain-containing protein [Pyxidicoccus xibeiensis]|uniref:helix-turn-helix domain-containing protein n=1 Tax=Pyxidicoccus xibeiensis TaxID=2906759 RepID=UPI0020A7F197|nr:AraC family transcriptional regulator [Pyxidicoccus xibeiensis]MCP3143923.1 AraC family transcriptional regulator [Pyxidicoccus xibeiensis]